MMNGINHGILVLLCIASNAFAQDAKIMRYYLSGEYQGKNVFAQARDRNSLEQECLFKITLNGTDISSMIEKYALEIDFTQMDIALGDTVVLMFEHSTSCWIDVLNPEVIRRYSTYDLVSMKIGPDTILRWSANYETGYHDYRVRQFRWNKWVDVGNVPVTPGRSGSYEFSVADFVHSGENKFKVDRSEPPGCRYLSSVKFRGEGENTPVVKYALNDDQTKVLFTIRTRYEIYDSYGNIVKTGRGTSIDISNLKRGIYYLNYDREMDKFRVKRKYRRRKDK